MGRLGGEEFLVVLLGTLAQRAHEVAEALRTALSGAIYDGFADDERATISLGVVEAGRDDDVESLLKRADSAMCRAKSEGRDRTVSA